MGVLTRPGSPYLWIWVPGVSVQPENTKIPIGATATERKANRQTAEQIIATRLLGAAKVRHGLPVDLADIPAPARLPRTEGRWCYIYFIRSGDEVKIGRAIDPQHRLKNLQVAHPHPLTLLAAVPAHADLEQAIHTRFAHRRQQGKWFRLEADLVAFIQQLQQGANPITLLWEAA